MKLKYMIPGLVFRAWIAFITITSLHLFGGESLAQTKLSLKKTGPQTLQLSWPSKDGKVYRTMSATNIAGPWSKILLPIMGDGEETNVSLPALKKAEYFRIAELPLDGALSLSKGELLSGTITIDITTLTSVGEIQSIGLWDIFAGATNVLDYIDLRDPARRSFVVNTVHMQNGLHYFQLELVNGGDVSCSEMVSIIVTNAVSVVSQIPTEFMRFLEFDPHIVSGTYSVVVKDDRGVIVQSTNGSIAGALSTNSSLIFKDDSVRFNNNYASTHFDYEISVTNSDGDSSGYSFRSPTISSYDWMEGTAVAQLPDGSTQDSFPEIDYMLLFIMNYHSLYSDPFFFDSLQRETTNEKWNYIGQSGFKVLNDYLIGKYERGPSHGHFLCHGGADYLGSRTADVQYGVSTLTLNTMSLSNRMSFVFIDGFNMPRSLLTHMTGITDVSKRSSRADLLREGRRPRLVFYWKDTPFPYAPGQDITEAHRIFVLDLYGELWKPMFGYPFQTIDLVLGKMRQKYPDIVDRLGMAGEYGNMFIDETVTHQ